MGRFNNVTGKQSKYNQTDPVYGTLDAAEVDAGIDSGDFVLMERDTHAKVNGRMVTSIDRRFMPKGEVAGKEKRGWRVVNLTGAERAAAIPTQTTQTKRKKQEAVEAE